MLRKHTVTDLSIREICCRLRICILSSPSIAHLRKRLLRLFRFSPNEESRWIKIMMHEKKETFASQFHLWLFLVPCSKSEYMIYYLFLTYDTLTTACHSLTRVQSSTTKANAPKNRAWYDSGFKCDQSHILMLKCSLTEIVCSSPQIGDADAKTPPSFLKNYRRHRYRKFIRFFW